VKGEEIPLVSEDDGVEILGEGEETEGRKSELSYRKEDDRRRREGKLAKDSAFEALRPPALMLPEGEHGYREGMPPYVAEPREDKSQEESRPILTNEAEDLEAVLGVLGEIQRCMGVDIVPTLRSSRPVTPQSPRAYFTPEKKSSETQTQDETPATDSDKSEPRLDQGA
jgi:hypothetical protein